MKSRIFSIILGLAMLAAPWAAQAAPWRLAVVTKAGSAQNICAENFARRVEWASRGRITVEIFADGAMGDELQILDKVRQGELELCVVTTGSFDSLAPQVRAVEYPFLFETYLQVDWVLQGPVGDKLLDSLESAGFRGLAFAENGFRNLTNNRQPVREAADVRGLRLRVMESKLQTALWRYLGAVPVPAPWPITKLLAQGKVQGQENPLGVIWNYRLDKVQKYLSLTRHVYSAHICAANLAWFKSLSPADQELVRQSMRKAATAQRAQNRCQAAQYLANLKKAGMQVVEKPDRSSFKRRLIDLDSTRLFDSPEVYRMLENFKAPLIP